MAWPPTRGAALSKSCFFSFCRTQVGSSSSRVAMAENSQKNFEEELQARLLDPTKRFELWQHMHSVCGSSPILRGTVLGAVAPHLTPSGTVQGAESSIPTPGGMFPAGFHGAPMWWPLFPPPFFTPLQARFPAAPSSAGHKSTPAVTRESSRSDSIPPAHRESLNPEGEDSGDKLALQEPDQDSLFDPSIESPGQMYQFLEKYFNSNLEDNEHEAITQDYPKPNCPALEVPRLDEELKQQIRWKGQDPHFGSEHTMFNL